MLVLIFPIELLTRVSTSYIKGVSTSVNPSFCLYLGIRHKRAEPKLARQHGHFLVQTRKVRSNTLASKLYWRLLVRFWCNKSNCKNNTSRYCLWELCLRNKQGCTWERVVLLAQQQEAGGFVRKATDTAHTACSDPEHALSHDEELRPTLKIDHMKKTNKFYMKS